MYVLIIYLLLGVAALYSLLAGEKRNIKVEWILYGGVVLLFVFRFSLGQDTDVYSWLFSNVTNPLKDALHSHTMRNVVFTTYAFLIKLVVKEFRWFVFVSNLIFFGVITWIVKQHSDYPLVSLLLVVGSGLLEVYAGSGLRQAMATVLFLYAFYEFLPKKQFVLYELFILMAIGCQEIAAAAVPIPLLYLLGKRFKEHPYRVTAILVLIGVAMLEVTYDGLPRIENYFINQYGYAPVWTHVLAYFHDREFSIAGIGMEAVFLIGIMILFYLSDQKQHTDFFRLELLTFIYSTVIYFAMSMYPLMSRCSDLLQSIMIVLVPELFSMIVSKRRVCASFAAVFLLNGFLLFVDLNEKCKYLTSSGLWETSITTYPYVTVFDASTVHGLPLD